MYPGILTSLPSNLSLNFTSLGVKTAVQGIKSFQPISESFAELEFASNSINTPKLQKRFLIMLRVILVIIFL